MPDAYLGETNTNNTCIFCAIIRNEEPAYTVFEDDISLAFLDRRPLFPGHCLLVPKVHYETLAWARTYVDLYAIAYGIDSKANSRALPG
jgi:hypothetical protein